MFAGFMYIALAVCLLLCAGREDDMRYGMTFEALLGAAIMMIQVKHCIKGFSLKSRTLLSKNRVRDKVRDKDVTSVYSRSSLVLPPVS